MCNICDASQVNASTQRFAAAAAFHQSSGDWSEALCTQRAAQALTSGTDKCMR